MISPLTSLAIRSILRNKRRALVTIVAVAFATMLSVTLRCIQIGTYRANIEQALLLGSGAGQIQDTAYLQTPSLQHAFVFSEELLDTIANINSVRAVSPVLTIPALASAAGVAKPIALLGVDATLEREVSAIPGKVREGSWLRSPPLNSEFEIVIGKEFAKRNGTSIGDTLVVLGSDRYGSMSNDFFTVVGIYSLGAKQLESRIMYTHFETAAYFAAVDSMCTMLKFTTFDADVAKSVASSINETLPHGVIARPWQELLPEMHQQIELDESSGVIMIGVLMLLVVLGVANTVYISVVERLREFGIMLAIGARNTLLLRIVALEVFCTTSAGVALGLLPGVAITYWLEHNPIELTSELGELYKEYGFLPQLHSVLDIPTVAWISAILLLACLTSAVLPLWRVYVLEPLRGIRHT